MFVYLNKTEIPVDGLAAESITRRQVEDLVNLLGFPDVFAIHGGREADDCTFQNSVLVPKSWGLA